MTHRWIAGKRTRSFSGDLHYTSITVEFISSVSTMFQTPSGSVGDKQLLWLQSDLKQMKNDARIVCDAPAFVRPVSRMGLATRDGSAVIDVLLQHRM